MNDNNQKTILLVEDMVLIAMAEARTINHWGYDVITAVTGEEAVQIATNLKAIDLILMDINLGVGIDGPEAARQILAKRNIPIVFLTSHAEKEYVDRVKAITRYGYVVKDSGDFILQSSIEMALELFDANKKMLQALSDCSLTEENLRMHQAELEMQNDEYQYKQQELEKMRAKLTELYDLAPVGYLTINDKGIILDANLTAAGQLGLSRSALLMQTFSRFVATEEQNAYFLYRQQLFATQKPQACALRMLRADGTGFTALLQAASLTEADGTQVCRLVVMNQAPGEAVK